MPHRKKLPMADTNASERRNKEEEPSPPPPTQRLRSSESEARDDGDPNLKSNKEEKALPMPTVPMKLLSDQGEQLNQIPFYSGNHMVEVTNGILHLVTERHDEEAQRSNLLCMQSIPTSKTIHDILQFVAPMKPDIENIRIMRDNQPNQFMVLLKFRSQRSAVEFHTTYNGTAYNSIEPDHCQLVFVSKVEMLKQSITEDNEAPTCPVCLERMDEEVEDILTILCNHSFHASCINKWEDTSCPVCRYCPTPEAVIDNICFECACKRDSLWICLVCGHIGCGRYVEGHAYEHYCETQHPYAMQLGTTNCVWDYAGDNYVHRLLQNNVDGKMVEVECSSLLHSTAEKIDAVQLEYTYLLTNQLEMQRHYFEQEAKRVQAEAQSQIDEIMEKTKALREERDELDQRVSALSKDKQSLSKKIAQLNTKMAKVSSELQEEREMNKCLRQNQSAWQDKMNNMEKAIETKDKELGELRDQVRDLMFFLEAQEKLKDMPDTTRQELEESQIVMSPNTSSKSKGKSGKRKS